MTERERWKRYDCYLHTALCFDAAEKISLSAPFTSIYGLVVMSWIWYAHDWLDELPYHWNVLTSENNQAFTMHTSEGKTSNILYQSQMEIWIPIWFGSRRQ